MESEGSVQLQFVGGDGAGGSVGDGAGGSPLEPHDPELGLPLHVQRESLLHAPLLSMVAQLNFCGTSFSEWKVCGCNSQS